MWDKVSWPCRSNFGGPQENNQENKKMCKLTHVSYKEIVVAQLNA
jgi:hypothetical protein